MVWTRSCCTTMGYKLQVCMRGLGRGGGQQFQVLSDRAWINTLASHCWGKEKNMSFLLVSVLNHIVMSCFSSFAASSVNKDDAHKESTVECPLCYRHFPSSEIQTHASDCQGPPSPPPKASYSQTQREMAGTSGVTRWMSGYFVLFAMWMCIRLENTWKQWILAIVYWMF